MREPITVSLPDDLRSNLDEAVREAGKSADELLCNALRDYLFFRKFRLVREHLTAKAEALGIRTDQDVFDRVS
ncbi:MAG: hypothetical protein ACRERS_04590 [Methylococcales bacterium]